MVILQQTKWAKGKQIKWLSEVQQFLVILITFSLSLQSYPAGRVTTASTDSSVDIEATYNPCLSNEPYTIPAPSKDEHLPVDETVAAFPQMPYKEEELENKLQEAEEEDEKTEEDRLKETTPALPDHEAEEKEAEETDAVDLVKTESVQPQDSEKKAIEEEPVPDITSKHEAPLDTTQSALELTQLFTDILVQYVTCNNYYSEQ